MLGAKLVTTTLDKLVRGNPLDSVAQIESIVSRFRESAGRAAGRGATATLLRPAPPDDRWTCARRFEIFLNARLARFGGIFLLGARF